MNSLISNQNRKRSYKLLGNNYEESMSMNIKRRKLNAGIVVINNVNNLSADENGTKETEHMGKISTSTKYNKVNPNELTMLKITRKYSHYKHHLKQYFIHDDMFLNLDQMIVEILSQILPKSVSIIINDYIISYFDGFDINNAIQHSNDKDLFWNDVYYQLNKQLLPVHDDHWYFWHNKSPMFTSVVQHCFACNDMRYLSHGLKSPSFNEIHNGLNQKLYYLSYNDQPYNHCRMEIARIQVEQRAEAKRKRVLLRSKWKLLNKDTTLKNIKAELKNF